MQILGYILLFWGIFCLFNIEFRNLSVLKIDTLNYISDTHLKNRIVFYKNKWKKNHRGLIVFDLIIIITLALTGFFLKIFLLLFAAYIFLIVSYLLIYNKMMAYVEAMAYINR
ncbi:MAG: hypothetical protein IJV15_01525 [Lachnospiraceae bacterium]|nr:hypothetical protein [Lachnospiraceae bacterium]